MSNVVGPLTSQTNSLVSGLLNFEPTSDTPDDISSLFLLAVGGSPNAVTDTLYVPAGTRTLVLYVPSPRILPPPVKLAELNVTCPPGTGLPSGKVTVPLMVYPPPPQPSVLTREIKLTKKRMFRIGLLGLVAPLAERMCDITVLSTPQARAGLTIYGNATLTPSATFARGTRIFGIETVLETDLTAPSPMRKWQTPGWYEPKA